MPLEPPQTDEEAKEIKKVETEESKPAQAQPAPQPVQADKQPTTGGGGYNQNYGGTMNFTRNGGMVSTSDNGVTSMGGVRYEAFNSGNSETSVRPSLAVVKTPQLTLKIYAPTKFDDQVKDIADDLLKRNAVIVNFESVSELEQQRIGDFIIGAVYTIDGRAEVVSNKIILYVPKEIEYETAAATLSAARRRYH